MIYTFHKQKRPVVKPVDIWDAIHEYEKEVTKMEQRIKIEQQIVKEWDIELEKRTVLDYSMKRGDVIRELELLYRLDKLSTS